MPGRKYEAGKGYRYGFNGQEKSTEINNEGNIYTAEFWEYDSRLGRRWNFDPKPLTDASVYSCFAGNPIFYLDQKGDSIPVHFLNKHNDLYSNYQNSIPDKVQKMFNEEYGIEVGFNSKTQMLFYKGDYKTDNIVSKSARGSIIKALSATYSRKKSERKFGELYFGYSGMQTRSGVGVSHGMSDVPIRFFGLGYRGAVYLNLDLFDDGDFRDKDLDYSGLTNKGYSVRTFNMARIFEHEWFGHILGRRNDPNQTEFRPGKVEYWPNLFRSEMGLPLKSNYSLHTGKGIVVLFGINGSQVKEAANDFKKIPNFPFVLSPIVKTQ